MSSSIESGLDLGSFSKELHLLVAMLELSNRPERLERVAQKIDDGTDWFLFLKLVEFHRVYPSIRHILQSVNRTIVPKQVSEEIHRLCVSNTLQMLYLTAELDRVNELFENNRVRALSLKGPALAQLLHGDISFRNSKDLDILVPLEDFEKAESLLLQSGYVRFGEGPRILNEWKIKRRNDSYIHSEKGIQIELHWRLYANFGKEPSFDELWERKNKQQFSNYPVYTLGKEDLFFYLVAHGAKHAWFRLRWLVDIDRMIHLGLAWSRTEALFKKYHCRHLGGQALLLASGLLGSPVREMRSMMSKRHSRRLAQEALFFINEPAAEGSSKEFNRYWYRLLSNRHKAAYVRRLLYPSYQDALTLPLPRKLHFLYFPLRPFLWVLRWMKRTFFQKAREQPTK
ncbi:nucleotidyltransferase domain-containing protein [Cohnella massiliensis]|uniref:nucleotidyltransferase domain-containing protein n=1 Tax=Cohnella massiliensis TaxID=1816691 RepID=UPI001594AC95|nr:nucleotidyltransferase family protein [Cohnella massiliensis]